MLEERKKAVKDAQATIGMEKEKQTSLKEELDHTRSLQPKVWCKEGCVYV